MTAQHRADTIESRLKSLDKHDPRRGALEAELRLWRHKALRVDIRKPRRVAA